MNYVEIENSLSKDADFAYRMIRRRGLRKAFLKGYFAASKGEPSTDCPYDHKKNVSGVEIPTSYAEKWHLGYQCFTAQ